MRLWELATGKQVKSFDMTWGVPCGVLTADGKYAISRSLYFYVKAAHIGKIPGLREYIREFTSEAASGDEGYLSDRGLIPLPEVDRKAVREASVKLTPLAL